MNRVIKYIINHNDFYDYIMTYKNNRIEFGGYVNLNNNTFIVTTEGQYAHINSLESYVPNLHNKFSWHTHPTSLIELISHYSNPCISIPSDIDFINNLKHSIAYSIQTHLIQQVCDVVITVYGVFLYRPSKELIKELLSYEQDEQDDIIHNFIRENIGDRTHKLFTDRKHTETQNAKEYIKKMKSIFSYIYKNIEYEIGYDCYYFSHRSMSLTKHNKKKSVKKLRSLSY